jgi:hypothetical protein
MLDRRSSVMSSVDNTFYGWLAAQPAFVEVAIGVVFVVVVAPATLALVALAATRLEEFCARLLIAVIHLHPSKKRLRTRVFQAPRARAGFGGS